MILFWVLFVSPIELLILVMQNLNHSLKEKKEEVEGELRVM